MPAVDLPGSGRRTSAVGFGCTGLMTSLGTTASLALLETAYEAGVRHFDVAPGYGLGEAERCLGVFLRSHPDATVATKYGLPRPRPAGATGIAHRALRESGGARLLRALGFRARSARARAAAIARPLSVAGARESLEQSLRALSVGRIDLWLLHEASTDRLPDDSLLEYLHSRVSAGDIGAFGVGSHRGLVTDLWERRRPYCDVIQTEWSVADDELDFPGAFLITHRSIAPGIHSIREHMATDSRGKDPRIAELGRDRGLLAQVMLRAAVLQRPEGIVLFSSKRKDHVASSVRAANDPSLDELAIALRSSVRRSVLRSSPRQA